MTPSVAGTYGGHESRIRTLETSQERIEKKLDRLIMGTLGIFGTAILSLIVQVIVALVKKP